MNQIKEEIRGILEDVARQKKDSFISYSDLVKKIKSAEFRPNDPELWNLLGIISEEEVAKGRAMLSVLVIHKHGDHKPGQGFFQWAEKIGRKLKEEDEDTFWLKELGLVRKIYKEGSRDRQHTTIGQAWVELYWPSSKERNLSELFIWFHDKKRIKNHSIKEGDRVLFYEVAEHDGYKGSKTIFASGTVLSETINIPPERQLRGNKRWLFKRVVRTDYAVPPERGIPLPRLKEILGFDGWVRTGFQLKDIEKFNTIENELREKQEEYNRNAPIDQKVEKSFTNKNAVTLQPSGGAFDESGRLAALEKALNVHIELLNKFSNTIINHDYKTWDNRNVDLFAEIKDSFWIFEVKSTNEDNFISQIRHGIAQLYEYRFHYAKGKVANLCLVVQTRPPKRCDWVMEYLKELGIHICWPIPGGFDFPPEHELNFLRQSTL